MIVEVIGLRGAGKSTVMYALRNQFVHTDPKGYDDVIKDCIRETGFRGKLKTDKDLKHQLADLDLWVNAVKHYPMAWQAFCNLAKRHESKEDHILTARKWFLRRHVLDVYMPPEDLCLWDKGLIQPLLKMLYQFDDFDQLLVKNLIKCWPKADLYVYVETPPAIAYERALKRNLPQWEQDHYTHTVSIFGRVLKELLLVGKVYTLPNKNNFKETPEWANLLSIL